MMQRTGKWKRPTLARWAMPIALLLVLAGCAAPSPAPAGQQPRERSGVQRTLVYANGREVDSLWIFGRTDNETTDMVHAGLVTRNAVTFSEEPWLAVERPSTEKGTWQVNPDGTMVTTWRLRPNIKWHDGTAFSSKDFAFGREVNLDPNVAFRNRRHANLMERIDTPDDQTLIIHWKTPYPLADRIFRTELPGLPRHILEPIYRAGEYQRFEESPYWTLQFIGTGPYRVLEFQPGAVLELQAYDDYFLGRPKIDRVTMRVISDANVLLTNVLTNDVHYTGRSGLTIDGALVAKEQWESQGQGKVHVTPINWRWVNLSGLNPWFDDRRVRRAMLHAIDREEMVRTLSQGVEQVIHVPLSPFRPQFSRLDQVITKYEYNPQRAQQLLAEAGWARGPDGVLVNQRGERFSFEARTGAGDRESEQLQAATISYWQAVGAELSINNLAPRVERDEQNRNRWPGANWASHNIQVEDWYDRYHSINIPTAENRWVTENVSRWTNPQKDVLLDEMNATLDRKRWDDLVVEFSRLFTVDLPHLPLKYASEVTTVRKGLKSVGPRIESGGENSRTWNIHLWEWTE